MEPSQQNSDQSGAPRSPDYGGRWGYGIFHWLIRLCGVRPAYVLLGFVVPYYVIFRSAARRAAAPYLSRRFPNLGRLGRFLKTVHHFYSFGQVLVDQAALGILGPEHCRVEFPSSRRLYEMARERKGVVLLTTHAGAWQSAMSNMAELDSSVHFQLRLEGHTSGRHFFDLSGQSDRFRIVSPDGFLGGLVELTNALAAGECVSVMGDRSFGGKTRKASFLGEDAEFPVTPYRLALATRAPIVVLLTVRTGPCSYRIEHTEIAVSDSVKQMPRDEAIGFLLGEYVKILEDYTNRHALMWFNFFDFWGSSVQDGD